MSKPSRISQNYYSRLVPPSQLWANSWLWQAFFRLLVTLPLRKPSRTKQTCDMALRSCTVSVDGSIPIQALLYDDEELFSSQDGVGIYNG
jgi:hypothetical protein